MLIFVIIIFMFILPSMFVLSLSIFLKFKYKVKTIFILLIIFIINIAYFGNIIFNGYKNEIKLKNEFNELFQLYDKDHPDYGLLKNQNILSDDEKRIWDRYFGDGGRKVGMYILVPIMYIFNILMIIILYFIINGIIYKIKMKK